MTNLTTHVFPNGLPAVYIHNPSDMVYTAVLVVGVGSRFETTDTHGISRFYTNVCLQGNKQYPSADQVSAATDKLGLTFRTTVNPEYILSYFSSIEELFIPSLKFFLDLYFSPLMTEESITKEKQLTSTEIQFTDLNPQFLALNKLIVSVFNNTSLGFDILGTSESMEKINLTALQTFQKTFYASQNCLLVIVGPSEKFAFDSLNEAVAVIPKGTRQKYEAFNFSNTKVIQEKESKMGNVSYLSYGALCFGRDSEKRIPQSLLINILAEGRTNKRFLTLQKDKIVSFIRPWIKIFSDCGLFLIQATCPSTKEADAMEAIEKQIKELETRPITQEEVDIARVYYQNRLLERMGNNLELGMFYGLSIFFSLPEQSPEQIIEEVKKVTPESVNELNKIIFRPDVISRVIVGPGY